MPKYTCVSRNTKGERVTAMVEAETRQGLLAQLKDQGLTVVDVKEAGAPDGKDPQAKKHWLFRPLPFTSNLGRISATELAIFWREFAAMIGAGLSIVETLQSIMEEMENEKFRTVLQGVTSSIWEGFNLSDSLKKYPRFFPPMVVALVGAAEESGSLAQVTNQLANYLENRDRIIRKVQAALTYPIFLSAFFFFALLFATFWVIPNFKKIYQSFDAKLPWLTQVVFNVNTFVLDHLLLILAVSLALCVALILYAKRPRGREQLEKALLKIPVFGVLIQRASIARFSRSLAILLSGGIAISRALEMAQETCGNSVVAKAVRLSREAILKGGKIAASMKQHAIFPAMAVRMVAAGEETGNLSDLLEKVADFYESRVDAALTTINALVEPVFIVLIGAFVLVFILSLYLPIFSLGAAVGG